MAARAKYILDAEDRTKLSTKSAEANFNRVNKSVKGLSGTILKLSVAYAGLRVVGSVINTHRKFEAAISDLAAITGATGDQLAYLTEQSKEFGRTTTLAASEAAEAFKLVASAKPDLLENAQALSAVTKEAISLAEASGSTLPDAARTLGSALNQYGAGAEEASRFINVLAAGAKFGASEIADTSLALKDSGLVAAGAGTSFEELNAAIQALSKVSLKGAEAGTGLRNVYLNLTKQTNSQYKPAVVGLTQAIQNLARDQLSDIELLEIFGKKNIVAAKAIISQSDSLGELTEKLTDTSTAYEQAAIKQDNLEGDIKKLNSAFEAQQISLVSGVNPALRGFTQSITKMITPGTELNKVMITTGKALTALAIAKILPPIFTRVSLSAAGMAASFTTATGRAVVLRGALSLLGGPVGIIAGVASAIFLFSNRSEEASSKVAELTERSERLGKSLKDIELQQINNDIRETKEEISRLSNEFQITVQKLAASKSIGASLADRAEFQSFTADLKALSASLKAFEDERTRITQAGAQARAGIKANEATNSTAAADRERAAELQKQRDAAITSLEQTRLALRTKTEVIKEAFDNRKAIIDNARAMGISNDVMLSNLEIQNEVNKQKALTDANKNGNDARARQDKLARAVAFSTTMQAIGLYASTMDTSNRKQFEKQKKINTAIAMINMFKGISQSLGAYPMPWAAIIAAAHGVIGLATVNNIRKQTYGGGGGGGGSIPTPSIPNITSGGSPSNENPIPGAGQDQPKRNVEIIIEGGEGRLFNGDQMRQLIGEIIDASDDMGRSSRIVVV